MPWTETAGHAYRRKRQRYASDLTDRECELIAPFMPPPRPLGRPRTTDLRDVMNANPLSGDDRVPVGSSAEALAALFDGSALFL